MNALFFITKTFEQEKIFIKQHDIIYGLCMVNKIGLWHNYQKFDALNYDLP